MLVQHLYSHNNNNNNNNNPTFDSIVPTYQLKLKDGRKTKTETKVVLVRE